VAVCPQGIDIRDGDQLECISCALCIDACDTIMDKVSRPRGLIAYDSYENATRRARGERTVLRFARPRTLLYAAVLILVSGIMLYALITRETLSIDAMRDRNPPFVHLADGGVRNGYTVRIINKARRPRDVILRTTGLPDAQLRAFGATADSNGAIALHVGPDRVTTQRIYVSSGRAGIGTVHMNFTLSDTANGDLATRSVVFVTGGPQ
jgi:polyferredoxin